ncbi:hypothetical protein N0V90_011974 [Kalmusia sp. IMI 367209]|nr:hypothetical protein N0V90_011974 [Kalmusia sp. IMI 367209]
MEPPAKRLRILKSVEVDETNPQYVAEKENQRVWLKSKFESIFAKYEGIPEAMSDEIDMRGNGQIAVDRGHMKKLDKEYRKRLGRRRAVQPDDTQLLDDLFADQNEMDLDDTELEEDDKDELAPSESPKPRKRKYVEPSSASAQNHQIITAIQPITNAPTNATSQATLPASANPAANLVQMIPFPQTPAGQQAQTAFVAQTAQVIQQAAMSIFSNFLSNLPSQQLNLLETPVTPVAKFTEIAPATAPGLHSRPPISQVPAVDERSNSIHCTWSEPKKIRRAFAKGVFIRSAGRDHSHTEIPKTLEINMAQSVDNIERTSVSIIDNQGVGVGKSAIKSRTKRPQQATRRSLYNFTAEDDQYIIESKVSHQRTWDEIISSRTKWTGWPKHPFHRRWQKHLREKASKLVAVKAMHPIVTAVDSDLNVKTSDHSSLKEPQVQDAHISSSPTVAHHLPTPSSLEYHEGKEHDEEVYNNACEDIEDIIASGDHFDADDRDLLSLAGTDQAMGDALEDAVTEEGTLELDVIQSTPEPNHAIMQSVEAETPWKKPSDDENTLRVSVSDETRTVIEANKYAAHDQTSPEDKTSVIALSPLKKSGQKLTSKLQPIKYQIDPESEDNLDFIEIESPMTKNKYQCTICKQSFGTETVLLRHQKEPHPKEVHVRPREQILETSPLPTASEDDELLAPATPHVKRESLTPPRNLLLTTPALKTPMSASQSMMGHSSGANSASKSRSAFLKKVKKSWAASAQKSMPGSKSAAKRRSLNLGPRKRAWDNFCDGSEDELAF